MHEISEQITKADERIEMMKDATKMFEDIR